MRFEEALGLFLAAKQGNGLSAKTIDWYRAQIEAFVAWLTAQNVRGADWLRPETLDRFLAAERGRISAATVAARYRALKNFFAWLEERGFLPAGHSPLRKLRQPKVPTTQPRQATTAEIRTLIDSIPQGSWLDLRDRLILRVLEFCGLRAAEVTSLWVGDIDVANELLLVRAGKGGDDRLVPMMGVVGRAYAAYLLCRPPWAGPELMLSADGSHLNAAGVLTVSGLRQMLKRRCAAAGVRYLNPHSFRHGLAIRLLNAGADMSLVQEVLGHSRIQTTQERYAKWQVEGLKLHYQAVMGRTDVDRSSTSVPTEPPDG